MYVYFLVINRQSLPSHVISVLPVFGPVFGEKTLTPLVLGSEDSIGCRDLKLSAFWDITPGIPDNITFSSGDPGD
eukprot:541123-Amorphochlora_amoeboformis.AAC.1